MKSKATYANLKGTGVYLIRNLITNDIYIGGTSAVAGFSSRKHGHFSLLRNNKHHSKILQEAYNMYGRHNFIFEILEYTEPNVAFKREQSYINSLIPKYNIDKVVKIKHRLYTPDERLKILKLNYEKNKQSTAQRIKLRRSMGWRMLSIKVPDACYYHLKKSYLLWKAENLQEWKKIKNK